MSYGQGLSEAIGCVLIIAVLGTIIIVGSASYFLFSRDEIVSKKPLVPEIRLVIKNNKVDTLYVYKVK